MTALKPVPGHGILSVRADLVILLETSVHHDLRISPEYRPSSQKIYHNLSSPGFLNYLALALTPDNLWL